MLLIIYSTHTHTPLQKHTCVCAGNCQVLLKCRCQFIRMKKWPTDSRPAALSQRESGPKRVEGGLREEELCTRTMHGPGSFAISVCHFQNVPAAASYHCPLRMTVLPMFRLLSFCFQMLNTAVCVCVCVGECVCNGACWSRQMFKFAALLPVCISSGQMSAPWQKRKGNGCRH